MYMCICVDVYMCVYVCVYIYIYIHSVLAVLQASGASNNMKLR